MNPIRPATSPVSPPPAGEPRRGVSPDGAEARAAASTEPGATASLWELLTAEERDFFAQGEALGPITYRPARAASSDPAAPTGRRVDVRG